MRKHNSILQNTLLLALCACLLSCACKNEKKSEEQAQQLKLYPANNSKVTTADTVLFGYDFPEPVDSAFLTINKKRFQMGTANKLAVRVNSIGTYGSLPYEITLYKNGNAVSKKSSLLLLPPKATMQRVAVTRTIPRENGIFTQGISLNEGQLYESSGGYGKSFIRTADFKTGKPSKRVELPAKYFAEGSVVLGDKLYVLTWQEKECLVFDKNTLEQIGTFRYPTEGWGLTTDNQWLYLSDGSSSIYKINPTDFSIVDKITVCDQNGPVTLLNELEWIEGALYANLFTTDYIVRIDPANGAVTKLFLAENIMDRSGLDQNEDVLNGILYDPSTKKVYITGKNWNKLFETDIR